MGSKQVLVMKKFPKDRNMRTGKYCSQASHASLGAFLSLGQYKNNELVIPLSNPFVKDWLIGRFTKITLYVETDDELIALHKAAEDAGIACSLIQDAGLTEFNGIPTLTAVGIGPDDENAINKITGHLKLF
jgi:PTH2 family peptidyl-tRNA hydrolase